MARVLVTGATGFLGKHLFDRLHKDGHAAFGTTMHVPLNDSIFYCNIQDATGVNALIQIIQPDIIIHCAAISSVTAAVAHDYYMVNTVGTENVAKAAASLSHKVRFIFISTAGVYGNQDVDYLHEHLCPMPVHHYGMSKFCAERLLFNYIDELELTIIRPFNIIGEGQSDDFLMPKLADAYHCRLPELYLGNLEVFRDYIDVTDACELISRLTFNTAAIGEICNLCTGSPVSLNALLDIFTKLTGHNIEIKVNPTFVRKNEVWRLLGDASKLESLTGGALKTKSIEECLHRLLAAKAKS